MRYVIILTVLALIAGGLLFYFHQRQNPSQAEPELKGNMKLTSSVFENNKSIPSKYTCDGENINPPLEISEVPEGSQSLVLIMDDPDAPAGTWDHWIVFNIPSDVSNIAEGEEPAGIHGKGTSNNLNYNGPCPPDKEHRYFFKLYALDAELNLPEGSSKREVEEAMQGHILDQARLIGLYDRQ
jgi:Raf kinase inhibitor-like YbhB/YbcL family protein